MTIQTFAAQLTRTTRYKLNNGNSIPVAGFCLYSVAASITADLVYEALMHGYRHIDTSAKYENQREAAKGIARFLKTHSKEVSREDIWFTTKIRNEDQGYEETKRAMAQIAKDVGEYIGYVDLVLVHSPKTSKEKRLGSWKALTEYYHNANNGVLQIRTIGVSNYGIKHIEEILAMDGAVVTPAVNQLELHPWLPRVRLREYLTKKGILIEAYSPLSRGKTLSDVELIELSKRFNTPEAEILLKWSYLQGFIVLVKSAHSERIKQNIEVLPESHGTSDVLHEGSNLGKIDLDPEILDVLDKPDSHVVYRCGSEDPTEYEDVE